MRSGRANLRALRAKFRPENADLRPIRGGVDRMMDGWVMGDGRLYRHLVFATARFMLNIFSLGIFSQLKKVL